MMIMGTREGTWSSGGIIAFWPVSTSAAATTAVTTTATTAVTTTATSATTAAADVTSPKQTEGAEI